MVSSGGLFVSPNGIVLDPFGDAFITDINAEGGNGAVIRVDIATGVQTLISSGGSFANPYGIAQDGNGDLYVTDFGAFGGAGAIFRVDPNTGEQTQIGGSVAGLVPYGIAVAANGDLLVVYDPPTGGPGRVDRVDPNTGAHTVISSGGLLVNPLDMTLDRDGSILVANQSNGSVNGPGSIVRVDPITGRRQRSSPVRRWRLLTAPPSPRTATCTCRTSSWAHSMPRSCVSRRMPTATSSAATPALASRSPARARLTTWLKATKSAPTPP